MTFIQGLKTFKYKDAVENMTTASSIFTTIYA